MSSPNVPCMCSATMYFAIYCLHRYARENVHEKCQLYVPSEYSPPFVIHGPSVERALTERLCTLDSNLIVIVRARLCLTVCRLYAYRTLHDVHTARSFRACDSCMRAVETCLLEQTPI